ncbi:MAG: peptidoglycan editing factor PgeF [Deltaproteobacteria bacterium]|nr:peptidoglycan editing factor PgeF [Deltaproteobacteria bacterium]
MDSPLIIKNINGLSFYQFSIFQSIPELIHGIFTRHGGNSRGAYASLNLSFSVGDSQQKVVKNRELVLKTLGIPSLRSLKQVHGKETVEIQDSLSKDSQPIPESRSGDILMTKVPKQGLMIKQADCQSILLYDPVHKAVANIHCGWRGNVHNVIGEAVTRMRAAYRTIPSNILAGIGPSLGPCCAQFINYRTEIPAKFWTYQARPFYFDLWRLSRDQLNAAGVLEDHIEIAGLCTSCRTRDFFSHRKEKKTGRFATVIALQ